LNKVPLGRWKAIDEQLTIIFSFFLDIEGGLQQADETGKE